jgi:PKD repeat protein
VASDKDWGAVSFGGYYNTTWFAQMNGYNEDEPSNDWLISPALDLDATGNEILEFFTIWKYGGVDDELKLKYSTDYTGGDPTAATWTEVPFSKAPDDDTWFSSGDISLGGISGSSVHVAFQYLSSGNPRRWGVDEILITEGPVVPSITVTSPATGNFWEQGTAHDIMWVASNTDPNVMIELTTDASSGSPTWTTLNASVPAAQGSWTWNISPTQTTSDDCQIRITDFTAEAEGLSGIFSIIEPIYVPQLVITEIMYNPPEGGTDSLEFVEVYNHDNVSVDMEGYYFSDGIDFTFPAMMLDPGEYVVLATDSAAFVDFYGVMAYDAGGALSNGGETIIIRNNYGMIVDSVTYDDADPWPTEPDGTGPSLRFCDPGLDNSIPDYWGVSIEFAGVNTDGDTVWASPAASCANWPVADFEADVTVILAGESVEFTDLSTGDPTTWVWTFIGGDPGSFVGQNPPTVMYNTPGTYNVALFVENVAGSSTKLIEDYITVGMEPVANFEGTPTSLYAGETVDFTDMSTDAETWEWMFEGGTPATSMEQNPTGILYETAGIYDVELVVTNMFGSDTLLMEDYIDVLPVGIGELENSLIQVYPNPNQGSFKLNNISEDEINVTINSLLGQKVYESRIAEGTHMINLNDLKSGLYLIKVYDNAGKIVATQKVMVY